MLVYKIVKKYRVLGHNGVIPYNFPHKCRDLGVSFFDIAVTITAGEGVYR
jgi:hypothetical protein